MKLTIGILLLSVLGAIADYIIESRKNKKSIFYENDGLVAVSIILILLIATVSLFFWPYR